LYQAVGAGGKCETRAAPESSAFLDGNPIGGRGGGNGGLMGLKTLVQFSDRSRQRIVRAAPQGAPAVYGKRIVPSGTAHLKHHVWR